MLKFSLKACDFMGNVLFGCALVLRTRYGNEAKPTLEGNEFVMSSPPRKRGENLGFLVGLKEIL